jgi:hypothetical protein
MKDELTENIKFRINETEHRLADLVAEPKWKGNIFFSTLRLDLRGRGLHSSTSQLNLTRVCHKITP